MSPGATRALERYVSSFFRITWGRRIEMGLALVATATRAACSHLPDPWIAEGIVGIAAAVFITTSPMRSWFIYKATQERLWRVFAKNLSLIDVPECRIGEIRGLAAGMSAEIWIPPGATADDYTKSSEALAVCFRAREVRITRDRDDAAHGSLTVLTRDPFAGEAIRWPWADVSHTDLWRGFPIGVDEDGSTVWLELSGHHVLVGGEPGAGKSNALSLIVSAASLDPSVQLWCFDPKLVELSRWRGPLKPSSERTSTMRTRRSGSSGPRCPPVTAGCSKRTYGGSHQSPGSAS